MTKPSDIGRKNRRLGLGVALAVSVMIGLAFASVPFYRMFCKATGFAGTPSYAKNLPTRVTARTVTVHFNADISPDLDWSFKPEQPDVTLTAGQKGFASFRAVNNTDATLSGTAIYNVVPLKVGKYFHKIQCFCFSEQTLNPHQDAHMPVIFFVDPAFADDIDMQDVNDITLSYTFFRADTPALERAVDRFYNQPTALPGPALNKGAGVKH